MQRAPVLFTFGAKALVRNHPFLGEGSVGRRAFAFDLFMEPRCGSGRRHLAIRALARCVEGFFGALASKIHDQVFSLFE